LPYAGLNGASGVGARFLRARKYEKYVISEPRRVFRTFDTKTNYPFEIYLNNEIVPGCNTFSDIYWRKEIPDINPVIPRHKHDTPMLLFFVGEPGSFEVEVPLDDEVYKITKTTLIWVPPGVEHSVDYKRIDNVVCEIGVVLGEFIKTPEGRG